MLSSLTKICSFPNFFSTLILAMHPIFREDLDGTRSYLWAELDFEESANEKWEYFEYLKLTCFPSLDNLEPDTSIYFSPLMGVHRCFIKWHSVFSFSDSSQAEKLSSSENMNCKVGELTTRTEDLIIRILMCGIMLDSVFCLNNKLNLYYQIITKCNSGIYTNLKYGEYY